MKKYERVAHDGNLVICRKIPLSGSTDYLILVNLDTNKFVNMESSDRDYFKGLVCVSREDYEIIADKINEVGRDINIDEVELRPEYLKMHDFFNKILF